MTSPNISLLQSRSLNLLYPSNFCPFVCMCVCMYVLPSGSLLWLHLFIFCNSQRQADRITSLTDMSGPADLEQAFYGVPWSETAVKGFQDIINRGNRIKFCSDSENGMAVVVSPGLSVGRGFPSLPSVSFSPSSHHHHYH